MVMRSLLLRSYIVFLMLSLATEVHVFTLKAFSVGSIPLSFFFMMVGMTIPLFFLQDFLLFLRDNRFLFILVILFFLSGLVSVLRSPFPRLYGAKWLFNYGLFLGTSFSLLFLFSRERGLGLFFLKTIASMSFLYALVSMIEVMDKDFLRLLSDTFRNGEQNIVHGWIRPGATFQHPNIFGCFMSLGILIFIYLKERSMVKGPVFFPAVLTLCIAMVLSTSQNALLVFLIPLVFLIFNRKTAPTAIVVLLVSCFLLAAMPSFQSKFTDLWNVRVNTEKAATDPGEIRDQDMTKTPGAYNPVASRLMLWESAIRMFKEHPVFGIGPGGYNRALKKYASPALLAVEKHKIDREYLNAHNGFFNLLAEFGTAGAILAILFFLLLLRKIIQRSGPVSSSPIYAIVLGIVLSFGPDAFFYSRFYMVLSLSLLFFFAFHEEARPDAISTPSKKPVFSKEDTRGVPSPV